MHAIKGTSPPETTPAAHSSGIRTASRSPTTTTTRSVFSSAIPSRRSPRKPRQPLSFTIGLSAPDGGSTVKSVRFADRTVVDLTKEPQPIRVLDGMYQSLDRVDAGGFNPGDALVAMQFLKEQQPNAVEDLTKMIKATKIADTPEKWAASLLEGSNDVNSPSPSEEEESNGVSGCPSKTMHPILVHILKPKTEILPAPNYQIHKQARWAMSHAYRVADTDVASTSSLWSHNASVESPVYENCTCGADSGNTYGNFARRIFTSCHDKPLRTEAIRADIRMRWQLLTHRLASSERTPSPSERTLHQ
nr:uncharacterized protein CTRU02_01005 [Colletotrichum truncatum]KAF6800600.1 hypothetical protein CTRU02_01005 [Colletotrichum truncatum]